MLLQDKMAWRTYNIAGLIQDLKKATQVNNKSIIGSKFWNKAFVPSLIMLLYVI